MVRTGTRNSPGARSGGSYAFGNALGMGTYAMGYMPDAGDPSSGGAEAASSGGQQAAMSAQGGYIPGLSGKLPVRPVVGANQGNVTQLNLRTIPGGKWYSIEVDRPTILFPVESTVSGVLYTVFGKARPDLYYHGIPSRGPGVAFLPANGVYQLWGNWTLDAGKNFIQIDASNSILAASLLSTTGTHKIVHNRATCPIAGGNATELCVADRERRGLILTNESTLYPIRLKFNANGGAAIANPYFFLPPRQVQEFSGESRIASNLLANCDDAGNTADISVLELY